MPLDHLSTQAPLHHSRNRAEAYLAQLCSQLRLEDCSTAPSLHRQGAYLDQHRINNKEEVYLDRLRLHKLGGPLARRSLSSNSWAVVASLVPRRIRKHKEEGCLEALEAP